MSGGLACEAVSFVVGRLGDLHLEGLRVVVVPHPGQGLDFLDVESAVEGEDLDVDVDPFDLGEDDVDRTDVRVSRHSVRGEVFAFEMDWVFGDPGCGGELRVAFGDAGAPPSCLHTTVSMGESWSPSRTSRKLTGNDVSARDAMGNERIDDDVSCGFGQLRSGKLTCTGPHRFGTGIC